MILLFKALYNLENGTLLFKALYNLHYNDNTIRAWLLSAKFYSHT